MQHGKDLHAPETRPFRLKILGGGEGEIIRNRHDCQFFLEAEMYGPRFQGKRYKGLRLSTGTWYREDHP